MSSKGRSVCVPCVPQGVGVCKVLPSEPIAIAINAKAHYFMCIGFLTFCCKFVAKRFFYYIFVAKCCIQYRLIKGLNCFATTEEGGDCRPPPITQERSFNFMKGIMTHDEVIALCKQIAKFHST